MSRKQINSIGFAALLWAPLQAGTVSGEVTDLYTGKPLNKVQVTTPVGVNAVSDSLGKFSMTVSATVLSRPSRDSRRSSRFNLDPQARAFVVNAIGREFGSADKGSAYSTALFPLPGANGGGVGTGLLEKSASGPALSLTFLKSGYQTLQKAVDGDEANLKIKLDTAKVDTSMGYHDFLFAGEWQRKGFTDQKMYIVKNGKVDWTFTTKKYNWTGEYGDATRLSNGNIVFSRQRGASMIDKDGNLLWDYPAPAGTEIHTCQPLGLGHVGIMQNGSPAKWMRINTATGKIEKELIIPTRTANTHGQFRIVRLTEQGTVLVAHMGQARLAEYDTATGQEIWTAKTKNGPWMAIRLKNGNTLAAVGFEVQEFDKTGKQVWGFGQADLPFRISYVQTVQRIANGNTIVSSWVMSDTEAQQKGSVQFFEVTPEKKVVWALKAFAPLGPSTSIQLLDEPGIPESFDQQR